jgi:hypothetical protein
MRATSFTAGLFIVSLSAGLLVAAAACSTVLGINHDYREGQEAADARVDAACSSDADGCSCIGAGCASAEIVSGILGPTAIAVDSTMLYWTETGSGASIAPTGALHWCRKPDCSNQGQVPLIDPFAVAVLADRVFVLATASTADKDPSILSIPKNSAAPLVDACGKLGPVQGTGPARIAADPSSVFVAAGNEIFACSQACPSVPCAHFGSGANTMSIAASSEPSAVAWFNTAGVVACPLVAGTCKPPPPLSVDVSASDRALARDETSVYLATPGVLRAIDVASGTSRTLFSGSFIPRALFVDSMRLYLATSDAVWAFPKSGGDPTPIGTNVGPIAIAVDDDSVYVLDARGKILRLSK